MPISLRDVATHAGVSPGTVSHVLNGNTRARIAVSTQERIRRVATELGYQPNRIARSLGRGRTEVIGLMISGLRNPFFVEILEAAERLAHAIGYETLLDAAPSVHGTFGGHFRLNSGWPVDGILVWAMALSDLTDIFSSTAPVAGREEGSVPVVQMGQKAGGSLGLSLDCVTFDYESGAREAMEYLIGRGRTRIAYVAPYPFGEDQPDEIRHQTYNRMCREAGFFPQTLLTGAEETLDAGNRVGQQVASLPPHLRPDALFCHNDVLAIGVYSGLRRGGIRVPEDIALVGFDGIEVGQYLDVPLTTVRTPAETLCRHSLERLTRRIDGEQSAPAEEIVLPVELIRGGTA